MQRIFLIRSLSMYLPILVCFALWRWRKPSRLEATGALLATAWNLPALLLVNLLAIRVGWWHFHAQGAIVDTIPVDLWMGWSVLWGTVTVLLFRRTQLWIVVAALAGLDFMLMPLCAPVVVLEGRWWLGEIVALVACCVPGILLARWTHRGIHVCRRAAMQVFCFSGLVALLLALLLVKTGGANNIAKLTRIQLEVWAQVVFVLALPGLSAVQEFATRGRGTPIPFDPPQTLVVSGAYAYLANPMQMSTVLVLLVMALALQNVWILAAAMVAFTYSSGLAAWNEGGDLTRRYGRPYLEYRNQVRDWIPRWHPYVSGTARLYIAEECGKCSEIGEFLTARKVRGLEIVPAESHSHRDLTRMTYDPQDGSTEQAGVVALARSLEHINLGWALMAMAIRLPGISLLIQAIVDISGGGPVRVMRRSMQMCVSASGDVPQK